MSLFKMLKAKIQTSRKFTSNLRKSVNNIFLGKL